MPFLDALPGKSQIFDYWKDKLGEFGICIDWGEPSCWACGFHYGSKYDIKRSDAPWQEIFSGWERIPLQRCHIVPRSLGGSDGVSNLFLMCRECHDLAPNTPSPEIFFEWARAQSHGKREDAKLLSAFEAFNIDPTDAHDFLGLIQSDEFQSWISGKIGLHRPQSNYAPTSSRLTPATLVGLAVQYKRMHG